MRLEKKTILLISLIFIAAFTALATLKIQKPLQPSHPLSNSVEDPRPLVDYADSTHDKNDLRRHSKGKRYEGGGVQKIGATDGLVTHFSDWEFNVPAIPAGVSDAVIVGTVLNSKAYLSPDATGVYSEFSIQVQEVLKDRTGTVSTSTPLAVDRRGARVRYPNGKIVKYVVAGQSMPRVNQRYVLFLTLENQDFQILTGYALHAGRVEPLDRVEKFKKHKGVDEATFLNQVRNAINSGSSGNSSMEK